MKPIKPKPGQESVWDYPRPPAIESVSKHIRITLEGQIILDTNQSYRILETSHPPTYYLPFHDFKEGVLVRNTHRSFCEFKGEAHYYDAVLGDRVIQNAGWGYDTPHPTYQSLKGHVCIYAQKMDDCRVGDKKVKPQPGGFYGGWITSEIVGPFKGGAGTFGW